jgi:hypothetical protein
MAGNSITFPQIKLFLNFWLASLARNAVGFSGSLGIFNMNRHMTQARAFILMSLV